MSKYERFLAAVGELCKAYDYEIFASEHEIIQVWDAIDADYKIADHFEDKTGSEATK